jgi:hypothetical protein
MLRNILECERSVHMQEASTFLLNKESLSGGGGSLNFKNSCQMHTTIQL